MSKTRIYSISAPTHIMPVVSRSMLFFSQSCPAATTTVSSLVAATVCRRKVISMLPSRRSRKEPKVSSNFISLLPIWSGYTCQAMNPDGQRARDHCKCKYFVGCCWCCRRCYRYCCIPPPAACCVIHPFPSFLSSYISPTTSRTQLLHKHLPLNLPRLFLFLHFAFNFPRFRLSLLEFLLDQCGSFVC